MQDRSQQEDSIAPWYDKSHVLGVAIEFRLGGYDHCVCNLGKGTSVINQLEEATSEVIDGLVRGGFPALDACCIGYCVRGVCFQEGGFLVKEVGKIVAVFSVVPLL
jgi:hypothetical protein